MVGGLTDKQATQMPGEHVIKFVKTQLEKMHVCFQLLQDRVKDITQDMLTIQKHNLVNTLPMAGVTETTTDLSRMMSAKLFVLKMTLILRNTWWTNVAFQ